jgi:N-formylglutamate amidohydrolase
MFTCQNLDCDVTARPEVRRVSSNDVAVLEDGTPLVISQPHSGVSTPSKLSDNLVAVLENVSQVDWMIASSRVISQRLLQAWATRC